MRRSEVHTEEQFRILVQGVTDYAIFMLDERGNVSSWNAGAQRIKGYAPDEIIGEHFSRFYTEEDREAGVPQQSLDTAIRDGRFEKEGWRVRQDGTRFVAHVVIDPIRNDAGTLIGFAKVTRDITEKRQAQQALEQAQHALLQTQKLESIGQLTGGIAHDFNNLLTAMINSLELLRKRVASDRQSLALVQNALDGAERGSTLTKRMLAFARRQELKLSSVDIAPLVSGMMGLLRRSIGPTIKIEADFPSDLSPVRSDANQMEAALLNLVVNARDAMPAGGTIKISARDASFGEDNRMGLTPGRYACLTVVDTGRGMDEETLAHATEPFFTTKGVGKGTGLGLSMVHGFAEQSGGKLKILSKLGIGTTAEIWLPASSSNASASVRSDSEEVAEPVASERLVILAVDDDELVLASTTATLEDFGHKIMEATNGMQALEIVAADRSINLVITDQAMPGMSGLELARAIKHLRPELPIILASGYSEVLGAMPADIRKLTKPYRRADLAEAIASAVQR
jgi:PAS domain S-box-containing protein